ncbi:MAG: hypothetical protein PW792_15885 [Acidobacteriaceae bacterium]|nr:hypothetical protein [Acidobacteriaceae bacterium]
MFSRRSLALLALSAFASVGVSEAQDATTIRVTPRVLHSGVKRFGINLSGQTFYDSGQMARNLIQRNPGFEGETWQTILRCKHFGQSSCSDENPYTVWPDHFLDGAWVQVLSGPAAGAISRVTDSHAATPPLGYSLAFNTLDREPQDNDFLLVRADKPGDPTAGWWTSFACGATAVAERGDLPPGSASHQAVRVNAAGACGHAELASYFDTLETHSFVHLHGTYTLSFRAKAAGGANTLRLALDRLDTHHGAAHFFEKSIPLTPAWHLYTFSFRADDKPGALGSVRLQFVLDNSSALLDDVSLTPARTPGNPTAFRDEVVSALREAHPGILRFMDNGSNFGASLDDLLAPSFSRRRTGYSTQDKTHEDIAYSVPEVLELAQAIGAEPWISLPAGFSPWEMQGLIEFLSAPASTRYGGRRAALGHAKPWTDAFPVIHLELGNEQWNSMSFSGAALHDPTAYGQRIASVYRAARTSPYFHPQRFDLIAGSWFAVPWWTEQEARAANGQADSFSVAPYLFSEFNDAASRESIFGSMFAQPSEWDTSGGGLAQQRAALEKAAHGKRLNVYEVNLGTATGSPNITQQQIDQTVPSLGGGLAVADHMLLMLREQGITDQCFFALPEYANGFTSRGGPKRNTPLWGGVVDMGGATNLRRPGFLALSAINRALLGNMVATESTGANPTWHQPASTNDKIAAGDIPLLQSFAFADGAKHSLVVFNLSRDRALPVHLAGIVANRNGVQVTTLTADHIEDSNENGEHVKLRDTAEKSIDAAATLPLSPFSMTVFSWTQP